MVSAAQSRLATRTIFFLATVLVFRWVFSSGSSTTTKSNGGKLVTSREIQAHNVIDRIRGDKSLDVHKHEFLQSRMGQFESFPLLIEGEKKGEEREEEGKVRRGRNQGDGSTRGSSGTRFQGWEEDGELYALSSTLSHAEQWAWRIRGLVEEGERGRKEGTWLDLRVSRDSPFLNSSISFQLRSRAAWIELLSRATTRPARHDPPRFYRPGGSFLSQSRGRIVRLHTIDLTPSLPFLLARPLSSLRSLNLTLFVEPFRLSIDTWC